MDEKDSNIFNYFLIALIVLSGIALRILYFSYNRPFWNDECALALNLVNRSYLGLFAPLDYFQATPPLYAWLCKFFGEVFLNKEFAYRLPALIFGILSIPAFYLLSKKILKTRLSILFSLMIFSLNYQLIYYSQELKQYSCEVFLFFVIILTYFYIEKNKPGGKKLISISLFYAVSIWFAYTSAFAVMILFLIFIFKNKKAVIPLFLMPIVSSIMLFLFSYRFHTDNYLSVFWAKGFIRHDFANFFSIIRDNSSFYFSDFPNKMMIILLFALGLFILLKNIKSIKSVIVLAPLFLGMILSYFSIYPMYLRTALYFFSFVILILSKPLDCIDLKNKFADYLVLGFIVLHFFVCSFKTDYRLIIQKDYYQETTPLLLKTFKEISKPGDVLIVSKLSEINFLYYKTTADINSRDVFIVNRQLYEKDEIRQAYDNLPDKRTYYIIFTHSGDKPYAFKNLKAYAEGKKNSKIISDKNFNALIKFEN